MFTCMSNGFWFLDKNIATLLKKKTNTRFFHELIILFRIMMELRLSNKLGTVMLVTSLDRLLIMVDK